MKPALVLAVAISGYKEVIDVAYDLPNLGKNLDFMSVMTYDYHGAWEKQTGHVSPLFHRQGDRYSQYNSVSNSPLIIVIQLLKVDSKNCPSCLTVNVVTN